MLPAIPDAFDRITLGARLEAARIRPVEHDDLLRSPVLRDREFAAAVHDWVDYWRGPAASWFPGFLERMAWLGPTVDSAVAAHGFPPSLRYLPLIESGYAPYVTSHAAAVGLWQLMPGTARDLGLEVSPLVDERRSPDRSTDAALRFLGDIQEDFDSWFFTLAAYNAGPARVRRILRRHAPGREPTDELFWELREHFPAETRAFVPKLFGAMWVASRPEAYGFETPTVDPWGFDAVSVPDQTTLDVVAEAAGVPFAEIVRLNPEYLRGITPPGREVGLKVPTGAGPTFATAYAALDPARRVTFVEHVVRRGETLSQIALRYGVRTGELQAANPAVVSRALQIGTRLTVPIAPDTARVAPDG